MAWPVNADRRSPWFKSVIAPAQPRAPEQRASGDGAERAHAAPLGEPRQRPDRELLEAEDVGPVGGREPDHLFEEVRVARAALAFPWKTFQVRTSSGKAGLV